MALYKKIAEAPLPAVFDWRTSDGDEIARRQQRAREEDFRIVNLTPAHRIFSNFEVKSPSGQTYHVEIYGLREKRFACACVDFRINGLGTCKHVETVLIHLERRFRKEFQAAAKGPSNRVDVTVDTRSGKLVARNGGSELPKQLRRWFDKNGMLANISPEDAVEKLVSASRGDLPSLRVAMEVGSWLETRRRSTEREKLRNHYELKVQSGEWPPHETKMPLFPYQREGMLHLAFTERALLADEMGLGKTIQAIAACALLHRLGIVRRALIVAPASLKTEWEEQIQRFTDLSYQLVFGGRKQRLMRYATPAFFTVANYEQMLSDSLDINAILKPDIVVLDEAQRIKNWNTKTARAVKRLRSRYAFVLTGTPIENRIDELHSLMDFLDPAVLGPLFRFNRDFYELNERGRPEGYRNLDQLHARIKPFMLRRRKNDVETELPKRTDRNHFVPMSDGQRASHDDHMHAVLKLHSTAKRRPLTKQELDKLQRELAMARMCCDTNYILDAEDRECPKLEELEKVLDECKENGTKVIVFSEWLRMLELVRELCRKMKLGYAWHTGSVPQLRRRAEINAFKSDPKCMVFLSTDSGSTGLNLQNASVVINCDLPWNPARLEQRIARAWRKNQTRPVTVVNLVSQDTIESRMLETLANKQALADGVLDLLGDLSKIKISSGRQAFLAKLDQFLVKPPETIPPLKPALPVDRSLAFARRLPGEINGALIRCEERYPEDAPHSVLLVVVDRDAPFYREKLKGLHGEYFGPGKIDPLAPVQLEVIDRGMDEALERLIEAGLIKRAVRTSRPLYPEGVTSGPQPLGEAEKKRAAEHREKATHSLKLGRVLAQAGFLLEARPHLGDAMLHAARTLSIEKRAPEPSNLEDVLRPPFALVWGESLVTLREASANKSDAGWKTIDEALSRVVGPNSEKPVVQ